MTTEYRVIVEAIERDEDGDPRGKVVLELLAPGEMLARFAPGAVAEVLGAERAAVTVVMPVDRPASPLPADVESPLAEPLPQAEAEPVADAEAGKPKRNRRTKAQIAADKEAQAAGFRDAAHRTEVEAASTGEGPTGNGDADLAAAAEATDNQTALAEAAATTGGVAPAAAPAVVEPDADPLHTAEDQAAPPPAAAPAGTPSALPAAEPWNPFAR